MSSKRGYSGAQTAARINAEQDSRGARYDARFRNPAYFFARERKEKKRAALEERVAATLQHAVERSSNPQEAALILARVAGGSAEMYERALAGGVYEKFKRGSQENPQEKEVSWTTRAAAILITLGFTATAASAVINHFEKNLNGWGAAAESDSGDWYGRERAGPDFEKFAGSHETLKNIIVSAVADGQLSVQERGQISAAADEIISQQNAFAADVYKFLIENQTREGGNVSVVTSQPNFGIEPKEIATEPYSKAFYNLRDQILPARDSNLAGAGVVKSVAANYSSADRLLQGMKEMVQAHQKNDAAVEKMNQTKTTVWPSEVSDIGTNNKTAAQLERLIKQLYNPTPDKDSFLEYLKDWMENPNSWDWTIGQYKNSPGAVAQSLSDFYSAKLAPVPYYTEVSDWAPAPEPPNHAPVIDEINVSGNGSVKYGYETLINITDSDINDSHTLQLKESPAGAVIEKINDKTWRVRWSPAQPGTYNFKIGASDGRDETPYSWQLNVVSGNNAPAIQEKEFNLSAQTRRAYFQNLTFIDPDGDPLEAKLIEAPDGMKFIQAGEGAAQIKWTPARNQTGVYNVTVEVSDGETPVRAVYKINVSSDNQNPRIVGEPQLFVKVGKQWEYRANASDPDGDSLTYELYFNGKLEEKNSSGIFSKVFSALGIGENPYRLVVRDGYGGAAEQNGTLKVLPNNPPQLQAVQKVYVERGKSAKIKLAANDPEGDAVSFSVANSPDGLNASVENGYLVLRGLKKGAGEITVVASDGTNNVSGQVQYEVKEKIITPSMTPYYLAGGLLAVAGGFGGVAAAHRFDRRVKVEQTFVLTGDGRPMGILDEKGNYKGIGEDGDDVLGGMLTAVRQFVKDGTKGNMRMFDYTVELPGKPRYKFLIEGNEKLILASVVRTEKPKRVRRISNALRNAINEGSVILKGKWDGDPESPIAKGVRASVMRNVYGREMGFREWLMELAGMQEEVELNFVYEPKLPEAPPAPFLNLSNITPAGTVFLKSSGPPDSLVRIDPVRPADRGVTSGVRAGDTDLGVLDLKDVKPRLPVPPPGQNARSAKPNEPPVLQPKRPASLEPGDRLFKKQITDAIRETDSWGKAVERLAKIYGKPSETIRRALTKEMYESFRKDMSEEQKGFRTPAQMGLLNLEPKRPSQEPGPLDRILNG